MAAESPIRIVLASMPEMLQKVVRGLLSGGDIQVEEEVATVETLSAMTPPAMSIVVIEADPVEFARACEALPHTRLLGITPDWHYANARFEDLSRGRLQDVVRCLAGGAST